jgi:predicted PurR-regulated permease PerM
MSIRTGRASLTLWFWLFGLGLALWLTISYLDVIFEIIWILFGAILLSLAMRSPVAFLERRHVPRSVTVLLFYTILTGLVVLFAVLLAPVVRQELNALRTDGPTLLQHSLDSLSKTGLTRWLPSTDTVASGLMQPISPLLADTIDTLTQFSRLILDLLVVLILAYFYTTTSPVSKEAFLQWFPRPQREHVEQVLDDSTNRLAHWVWAQMGIAVLLAIVMSGGLYLLGVPFALTIGITGGVLQIIPFLGGILAALLALASALTVSTWLALWVLVFYLAVLAVESHVLAPVIYGKAFGLRSATVLLALFVGAKVQGVIGVIFAVPVSVVLVALLQEVQSARASARAVHTDVENQDQLSHLAAHRAG